MLASWHFHIEVSSKCTLRCPRCARAEVPNSLINTELDLNFFKKNFTPEFVLANVEKITFCGDDGDPIYAHDLIPIISYIKSIKPVEFVIVTNGSYKKPSWWSELGRLLDTNDSVHFSIDGYDHASNNQYRVNSDWDSIVNGIKALRAASSCEIVWAAIAFSFNEDFLDNMQSQAVDLGCDRFQITKSTKFGSIYPNYGVYDPLEPSNKWQSTTKRFERENRVLTGRGAQRDTNIINIQRYNSVKNMTPVVPLCAIGNKGLYIDAQGKLFPCCWVANRYSHNSEWQTISKKFNLNNISLEQALADSFWTTDFQTFKWIECQTKCHTSVVNQEYASSW